jgi:hypothetical protein
MMNTWTSNRGSALVLAVVLAQFLTLSLPTSVRAQEAIAPEPTERVAYTAYGWDDNSDELPGFSTGEVLLVLGAVAAVTIAATALVRRSKARKETRQVRTDSTSTQSSYLNYGPRSHDAGFPARSPLKEKPEHAPFDLSVGLRQIKLQDSERYDIGTGLMGRGVVVRISFPL